MSFRNWIHLEKFVFFFKKTVERDMYSRLMAKEYIGRDIQYELGVCGFRMSINEKKLTSCKSISTVQGQITRLICHSKEFGLYLQIYNK